jgi:hypothetical protein
MPQILREFYSLRKKLLLGAKPQGFVTGHDFTGCGKTPPGEGYRL